MATFNIFGMCICRDIFSLIPNQHQVIHFLQSTSPILQFIYNKEPHKKMDILDLEDCTTISNFSKKCIINDYNRSINDYFITKADYFILDLVSLVHTFIGEYRYDDNNIHYVTASEFFLKAFSEILQSTFFYNKSIQYIKPIVFLEQIGIHNIITAYVDWLIKSKGYAEDKIICIENRSTNFYTDKIALYKFNYDYEEENTMLKKIYRELQNTCPQCNIIKIPQAIYAYEAHKWGLSDLHFSIEYYEYVYKCIEIIIHNADKIQRQNELFRIYEEYSEFFYKSTIHLIQNSFLLLDNRQKLLGCLNGVYIDSYIIKKGCEYYESFECKKVCGLLDKDYAVNIYSNDTVEIILNNLRYYTLRKNCLKGVTGHNQFFHYWQTQNNTTSVEFTDHSVIISHNGDTKNYQANIIQIIENPTLAHKHIVFSVYSRVLSTNANGGGGCIAIINAPHYNNGAFFSSKNFVNTEWQRIFITCLLPDREHFNGLTVCLRANVDIKTNSGATVEFRDPKLEIGTFPTSFLS